MSAPVAFMSLSVGEIAVLGVVALLVFGGRLPEVMRNVGRAYARFRRGMDDLANPLREEMRRLDVRDAAKPIPRRAQKDLPLPERNPPAGVYDIGNEPEAREDHDAEPEVAPPSPNLAPDPVPAPKRYDDDVRGTAADEPPPV